MTRVNRLGMYADIRAVLDAALEGGGGIVKCADYGKAVHWRQRAYKFRKLYAEILGPKNMSIYDSLVMPRIADGDNEVVIKICQPSIIFTPANDSLAPTTNDELLEAAEALARKLGGSHEAR